MANLILEIKSLRVGELESWKNLTKITHLVNNGARHQNGTKGTHNV